MRASELAPAGDDVARAARQHHKAGRRDGQRCRRSGGRGPSAREARRHRRKSACACSGRSPGAGRQAWARPLTSRAGTAPGSRRARPPRAAGHRRNGPKTHDRHAGRAHAPGSADCTSGVRATDEPRDRCSALSQPPHGRVPPAKGVREARHQLAQGAGGRSARSEARARTRLTRPAARAGGWTGASDGRDQSRQTRRSCLNSASEGTDR
jgi:hypothetical protein